MKRITIIGGGASGTLLAVNLLKFQGDERVEVNLIEKRASIGHGVAFSTAHDVHLLNVPVAKMGAFPDDVEHFHKWLQLEGHEYGPNDFVPRKFFGEYLRDILETGSSAARPNVVLNIYDDEAVDVHLKDGKAEVVLASGDIHYSEAVVLAFGNFLPPHPSVSDLAFTSAKKYFRDPWSPEVETDIAADDEVLIIGTGLSMADAVMRLQSVGHKGKITAVSTRGLLPAVHKLGFTHASFYDEIKGTTKITELLKAVRRQIAIAESNGSDWRAVIDSLRPHTQALWLDLPLAEKRYFMQHLSRYWNVARHRMPPGAFTVIEEMQTNGMLEILNGRLKRIEQTDGRFAIDYKASGEMNTIKADAIINCIGSESNFSNLDSELVRNLFASGTIRCDDLNFGLDAEPDGTLKDEKGTPSPLLFTLGTALKGILWESTTIPEIRVQARDLAARLLDNHQLPIADSR